MKRLIFSVIAIATIFLVTPTAAFAAPAPSPGVCTGGPIGILLLKPWDACLAHDAHGAPLLRSLTDVWLIFLPILEDAIKAAGYTAAGFVIWGGIKYIKSQGDPGQFNEARQVIHNALFGLVLALISVALVNFIAGSIN